MEKKQRLSKDIFHPCKVCRVCNDVARGLNYNVMTCVSCKTFFRRNAYRQLVSFSSF